LKLAGKPTALSGFSNDLPPHIHYQADWTQSNITASNFIKDKPLMVNDPAGTLRLRVYSSNASSNWSSSNLAVLPNTGSIVLGSNVSHDIVHLTVYSAGAAYPNGVT
jgi:hypothetical protein